MVHLKRRVLLSTKPPEDKAQAAFRLHFNARRSALETIILLARDYDGLRTCPFCGSIDNLIRDRNDKCPHLVAAFQYLGDFDSESWQKVSSDGHLFRRRMMDFLAELPEAVCKLTTQTRWSPTIRAYYHPLPAFVTDLRMTFKIEQEIHKLCGTCGQPCFIDDDSGWSACPNCGV
jgi:hypothetical protein